uniref:Serine O-acetyltransferase n=1 Tax=uncultured Chloroflexota bacterium TaxID=166587 RepID=H5SPH3_9CHLR|nr:serine O-acetyltransferase [uncultured Chloroflexota bacterium]
MSETTTRQIRWTLHDTNPELVEPLREKLSQVVDPEIGLNVIQLGLIREVRIEDNNVARMRMILTTPFCPYGPALIEMTRQKAQEALGRPVTIEMGMEMWDFSMMEDPSILDWGLYA